MRRLYGDWSWQVDSPSKTQQYRSKEIRITLLTLQGSLTILIQANYCDLYPKRTSTYFIYKAIDILIWYRTADKQS